MTLKLNMPKITLRYQFMKNARTRLIRKSMNSNALRGAGSLMNRLPIMNIGSRFWKKSAVTLPKFYAKNTPNMFTGRIKSIAIAPVWTLSVILHSTFVIRTTEIIDEMTV